MTDEVLAAELALAEEFVAIEEVESRECKQANEGGNTQSTATFDGSLHEEPGEALGKIRKENGAITEAGGRKAGQQSHDGECPAETAHFSVKLKQGRFELLNVDDVLGDCGSRRLRLCHTRLV